VGKLLGTGASGESHFNQVCIIFLNFLASVFQGKDIMTGIDVALKIGLAEGSSSKLGYEYDVYMAISGSTGISGVIWYGKEGLYEVIVMEYLGTSLDDLIREQQFDPKRMFLHASRMVCLFLRIKGSP
jgi:serine/threonine protein kinase